LVHNHPSGDPTPSRTDIDITREIVDALAPFEIRVHDHLIAAKRGVTSFKSEGLI
jgi:DNA repair protein RadC